MTAIPCFDFHMHTKYLKCANATMEVDAIIKECERLGVTRLGITDHLNTVEKLEYHRYIRKDIENLDTEIEVFFGVELNYQEMDGAFAFSQEIKDEYGFQFAVGGIHGTYSDTYDLKKILETQHRHHLKTCRDPLVDVLVHPYWFGKHEFNQKEWPWFDSMEAVPESHARELGQVAKETGTAIEINACGHFTNPHHSERYTKEYIEFLAIVAAEGPCFSVASDAHDINNLQDVRAAWQVAAELNLPPSRIWSPACAPLAGGVDLR